MRSPAGPPLVLLVAAAAAHLAAGSVVSVALTASDGSPTAAALVGGLVRVAFQIVVTPGDAGNLTRARLYPYVDGGAGLAQYGGEVAVLRAVDSTTASGIATLPLPWSARGATLRLTLAAHAPLTGPTMGAPPPPGAVLSNALPVALTPRVPARPPRAANASLTVYWEPW